MKPTLTCENNTTPGPTTRIEVHTLLTVIQRELGTRGEFFFKTDYSMKNIPNLRRLNFRCIWSTSALIILGLDF